MTQSNSELDKGIDTLFEIARQREAVVREFDRATFAQIAQVQALLADHPHLVGQYRDILVRGQRLTKASEYLASLNIPGYTHVPMQSVSAEEVDRAAVFMSIFAPSDPEFEVWKQVSGFELEGAIGRLGLSTSGGTSPRLDYELKLPESQPSAVEVTQEEETSVPPTSNVTEQGTIVNQVLFDDVVLHLSDDAQKILLALRDAGERLTVGRIRKALGDAYASFSAANINKCIRQVNEEFAKNYEGELIQSLGSGWFLIHSDTASRLSTQDVIKREAQVSEVDKEPAIEVATRTVLAIKYRGKDVGLNDGLFSAIIKVLLDSSEPMNAEAMLSHDLIKEYADMYPGNRLKEALRDGIFSIQDLFASKYGIEVSIDRTGALLPNEFSRHEGILLVSGMRRGRKYTVSPAHRSHLFAEVVISQGEIAIDNRNDEEKEAERLSNLRKISVRIYNTLHTTDTPLSIAELANVLLHSEYPEGASKSTRDEFTNLVFAGFQFLQQQGGLFTKRSTQLKILPPIEGDPIKYQIIDIDEVPIATEQAGTLNDRLGDRRERLRVDRERPQEDPRPAEERRAPKVMDDKNKLYATYALVDGSRIDFTNHESAVIAVLSAQPSKTPIDATKITGILRSTDSTITRGDVDGALSSLQVKLREGWIVVGVDSQKRPTYRFGKNVGVKSHTR